MTNVLATKAVLASLNISLWTARKYDKKISEDTNQRHNAEKDAGRYNKLLIAKNRVDTMLKKAVNTRAFHYEITQPWLDAGPRLLATANYMKHADAIRKDKMEFDALADQFALDYPAMVEEAKKRLNGMFDANDYPSPASIRSRFSFDIKYLPCPDSSDFRVSLSKEIMEEMKSDVETRLQDALENAMRDARDRVIKIVGHMAEKLTAYKPGAEGIRAEGTFHDSLVQNVRDLADLLPSFNLTGDKKFTKIIDRITKQLCEVEAKELRENEAERLNVAKQAASILAEVEKFMA